MLRRQGLRLVCGGGGGGGGGIITSSSSDWGVLMMTLLYYNNYYYKDPFFFAGLHLHGFSHSKLCVAKEVERYRYSRFPPPTAKSSSSFSSSSSSSLVGDVNGSSSRFQKINAAIDAAAGLSLKGGCSDRFYDCLRRRVDDGFQKPPRALGPYIQLVRDYDSEEVEVGLELELELELEGDRAATATATARLMNGRGTYQQRGSPLGFPDHSMPKKLIVAVDVDEVLGSFISALNKFIADRYSLNCSVSEYHVYEFFKIWNCSRDEADIRVHEFFKTSYFKTGIHPIPGAQRILHKLSSFCDLSVVTSRQNVIKDHTIEWIEKHYPGLFREIHFGNHFALDGKSRPKSDICRSFGAQVLIDDNPRYAVECAEAGIRVLLFDYQNSYPWCKTGSDNLHPLVTKVHDWEEVEQQLGSWITS